MDANGEGGKRETSIEAARWPPEPSDPEVASCSHSRLFAFIGGLARYGRSPGPHIPEAGSAQPQFLCVLCAGCGLP
jgi:hypothetical protein